MIAGILHQRIISVCPTDGISIGRRDDKSTWKIGFLSKATDKQRADANAVVDAFDWQAEEVLLEKVEKHKRVAALKAARTEAVAAGDVEAADAIQDEIDTVN